MKQFENRKYFIGGIVVLVSLILIVKLFFVQVLNESYRLSAESNSRRMQILYPARGLIYDRNGELLVYNQAAYDLMISPFQLSDFDTTEFCEILGIEKSYVRENINKPKYRRDPFIKQISPETYAILQEKMYKFPGFYVYPRTLRKYSDSIAAHLLGYVGEVSEKEIEHNPYYAQGDYIGKSGLELSYEKYLRGEKGVKYYNVDVQGRIKGSYANGNYDRPAVVGKDVVCTIDKNLQQYGEKLMKPFRGSIVAIEPKTGEVLSLVTAPSYDPSLLVGRVRTQNFRMLQQDTLKPLFNRAVRAMYPPGSTFKVINGLIGLQEGVVYTGSHYYCDLGYYYRGVRVGCHPHDAPLNLPEAVQNSCNAYFCNVFRNIIENPLYESQAEAFSKWREYVTSFGFGQDLDTDLPYERSGIVPKTEYYDRYYGENRWKFITVISLAIGQGELGITPLQMGNMTAAVANRGYYMTPHTVKKIEGKQELPERFLQKNYAKIDTQLYEPIIEGMELAVNGGKGSTARIAALKDIVVCGKTGTAENPHGEDHSIFVAFAPKDDPEIAVAVYVENGGYGSTYAAPIASLMIEKYLIGEISWRRKWIEQRMLNAELEYE